MKTIVCEESQPSSLNLLGLQQWPTCNKKEENAISFPDVQSSVVHCKRVGYASTLEVPLSSGIPLCININHGTEKLER